MIKIRHIYFIFTAVNKFFEVITFVSYLYVMYTVKKNNIIKIKLKILVP